MGPGKCCRKEAIQVRYYRIPELLLEIEDSKENGMYLKFMRSFQKLRLLILNDVGLKLYTIEESRNTLEVVQSRCTGFQLFCLPKPIITEGMSCLQILIVLMP
jgi:DNA replication protein DnaC